MNTGRRLLDIGSTLQFIYSLIFMTCFGSSLTSLTSQDNM